MNQPDPKPTGRALTMREIRERLGHNLDTPQPPADRAASGSGRAAEAELYVLLRKAGEDRYEAQALIDRHADEVLRRAGLRRMAGEPQQDRLSTAEKAADLGLTDTEYRARSHAAAVAAVRAAIPGMYATVGFRLEDVLNEAAAERQDPAPDGTAGCGCPNEDAPEHGFGTEGCDCVPFTRQTTPPRILDRPTDTVDMISGWERGADCPHHARSGQPETDDTAVDRATLIDLVRDFLDPDPCSFDHHGYCQAHGYLGGEPGSCPHGRARKLLAAVEAAPSGQPETDDKAGS